MLGRAVGRRLARVALSVVAFTAVMLFGLPRTAQAQSQQSPHRLHWQSDWRRVGGVEYVVTTGLFAAFVGVWFLPPLNAAIWTNPVAIDESTRGALRARTRSGRDLAGTISDGIAIGTYLPPVIIDPLFIAGIEDENPDVAWQMFVITTQSYAITITANAVSKRLFARQRPYAFACAKDPDYSGSCQDADRFRSFYSGHSAITATSAGLICAHHTHLPLYGGGNIDRMTCAAALGGMLATGVLRIVADKHWHSDVAVGHIIGLTVGYLLPTLVYYRSFRSKPDPQTSTSTASAAISSPAVVTAAFSF